MSDSDSDMVEEVSFSTAKKNIISGQKQLKQATLAVAPKKKRVRRRNELSDDDENDKKQLKGTNKQQQSEKQLNNKSTNSQPQSLNAKVDQNLLNLINEELPTKKIKQIEGKFKVVERSENKIDKIEPKKLTIQSEVYTAKKDLGQGIKVVFQKSVKQQTAVNSSATNFLQNRLNLSSAKRQPISRIIGTK
ncbi:hypothetical protein TTHERM_00820690 (macronuclear) [Tetrahymena thermophila SB210]|uniref:Uncharacterized protein n=1 Tax=Tetrahymena thermophila (strain SB210) TaxID=312017 RepID=Q23H76_TETTS|nr:hypothetical protein TTHERM_00820690 [Tetrahymena thermophila SB210]EAR95932.1 hypothetical protein TTHERM_00820690 [Tetrahymena thermophila SB210]|eukprot:XP_001016177.1 hypothetical protein TTHERM_00820690 [Tetrahymena thermophila SB210]